MSQLIFQGYEDTRKLCRKGDIHDRVTEGYVPRNEMLDARRTYMWQKAIVGTPAGFATLLVY